MTFARYTCEGYAWPDPAGRFMLHSAHEAAIATLTRERDEARAELAMAYTRALQAAADVVREHPREDAFFEHVRDGLLEEILALTPEDIASITKEHEHG